jgi:NAD(P)-dependent dehydrogenase (short-subunit alcohol dehydrogenase family)
MNTFESVKGKVAVVTGGTSGIGREITKTFAANGMHVVFSGRNEERGSKIVSDITAAGGDAMFVKADVRSEEDVRALVDAAVKKYGRLNVMVNNAGVTPPLKPLHEYDLAEFNRVTESNYTSLFFGTKYAVQAMLDTASRECAVINIASASGLKATECFSPYDGSKHAAVGLTKTCALDYAKHDITVNAICPGVIDTEIFANAPEEVREINKKAVPIGRFGRPEEIAYLALFLATDMARFMTGSIITADGGYTSGDQNNMPWTTPDPRDLSYLEK